jgi:hypothetical protein
VPLGTRIKYELLSVTGLFATDGVTPSCGRFVYFIAAFTSRIVLSCASHKVKLDHFNGTSIFLIPACCILLLIPSFRRAFLDELSRTPVEDGFISIISLFCSVNQSYFYPNTTTTHSVSNPSSTYGDDDIIKCVKAINSINMRILGILGFGYESDDDGFINFGHSSNADED